MANEVNEAFRLIRSRLVAVAPFSGPSAIPVFASDQVPQNQATPYVLIDFAAGSDFNGSGTSRIASLPLMLVRVVNRGSIDAAARAADIALDDALQTASAVASGGYVFTVRRETPYRRSYRDDAQNLWSESGGYYRLFAAQGG